MGSLLKMSSAKANGNAGEGRQSSRVGRESAAIPILAGFCGSGMHHVEGSTNRGG